jgi:hypothetical protein
MQFSVLYVCDPLSAGRQTQPEFGESETMVRGIHDSTDQHTSFAVKLTVKKKMLKCPESVPRGVATLF